MVSKINKNDKMISTLLAVLVIGSIWGMLEMTLGGFLHAFNFPQKGAVMGGIAVSFMALFVTLTGKPSFVPFLGIIAALFKPFNAFIFGVPLFSPMVVNPAIAIIMEALAFTAVAFIFKSAMDKNLSVKISAGFLAGSLGIILYAVFASVFGLGIWPHLDLTEKLHTALTAAIPAGIAGALMLAAGQYIGKISIPGINVFMNIYQKAYYPALATVIILCWAIPVILRTGI